MGSICFHITLYYNWYFEWSKAPRIYADARHGYDVQVSPSTVSLMVHGYGNRIQIQHDMGTLVQILKKQDMIWLGYVNVYAYVYISISLCAYAFYTQQHAPHVHAFVYMHTNICMYIFMHVKKNYKAQQGIGYQNNVIQTHKVALTLIRSLFGHHSNSQIPINTSYFNINRLQN